MTMTASTAFLARLPTGPDVKSPVANTTANWTKYFDDLEPLLTKFKKSALPADLGLAPTMNMGDVRKELAQKVVRPLAAFKGNLVKDAATWKRYEMRWATLRTLADEVKGYSEKDQVRLAGAPVIPPAVTLTTAELGWIDDIKREAVAIGIDTGDADAIAASVRLVREQDEITTTFLRLMASIFAELNDGQDRFDSPSLIKHLCKLKTDREGFTGIIAEVEAALMMLKRGVVGPTVNIKMGEALTRDAPYKAATTTQDIDIIYDDVSGVVTLVEVKDQVITLEKKMNLNAGGKYIPPTMPTPHVASKHEHHYDPMQLSSLLAAREAVAKNRGGRAVLKIVCVRPRGWVRFMLSRHSLTLASNEVVLQIGKVEFLPSTIRVFRDYLEIAMDKFAPNWRAEQRADPTLTGGRARDQDIWDYEAIHPWGTHKFTH